MVDQQPRRPGVVAHQHVDVAVVVDVPERGAAPRLRRFERRAGLLRHVREAAVAEVAEQRPALIVGKPPRGAPRPRRDRAVHGQQIQPAVVVEVEPGGAPPGVGEAAGAEPRAGAAVLEPARPVVDVEVVPLAVQVGQEEVLVAVVVEVARVHPHARLGHAQSAQRRAGQQPGLAERPVAAVDPQQVLDAVVGDVDVDPAVAVEVGGGDAERRTEPAAGQRDVAHVDEPPLPRVAVQVIRRAAVGLRRAIVAGVGQGAALDAVLQRVVDVVADVEVEPAVAVVVDEGGRDAEAGGRAQTALGRRLPERAVAAVQVERVRAEVGQEEIRPAVVVHVPGGHAEPVAVRLDPARRGHVGEPEAARAVRADRQVVAVEPAPERPRPRRRDERVAGGQLRVQHPALDQIGVEVAVVVVVEQPDARGDELRVVETAGRTVEVEEVEAGGGRLVGEPLPGGNLERGGRRRPAVRAGRAAGPGRAAGRGHEQERGARCGMRERTWKVGTSRAPRHLGHGARCGKRERTVGDGH